jgi:predicted esterase
MRPRFAWPMLLILIAPSLLLAQGREGREATLLFKDGFHISGKVIEKNDFLLDPASGQMFRIPAVGGFMHVDDEVRRIIFSPSQVLEPIPKKLWPDLIQLSKYRPTSAANKVLPTWEVQRVGNWNAKWERVYSMLTFGGTRQLDMDQRITLFTPRHFRVDALKYEWALFYMTRELDPDVVRHLLYQYYNDKKDIKEPDKLLSIARFLHQGGWLDPADRELERILQNHPEAKESALALRDTLKQQRTQLLAEDIERGHKIGQHQEVQDKLANFFKKDLGKWVKEENLLALQDLKNKYEANNEKIKQVTAYLKELPRKVPSTSQAFWTQATDTILEEINHDSFSRLETFLAYARQYLNEVQENRKPTQSVEEVLALAITGWHLGDNAAEPDVKIAQQIWRARRTLLELQKTPQFTKRTELAQSLALEKELAPDLLGRIIRQLPPANPFPLDKAGETSTVNYDLVDGNAGSYLVHLPPDYHPLRPYPVLILLHGAREKPAALVDRFTEQAAQHGFILVAPLWGSGFQATYNYTAREHALVLDCLRDVRQRFQIDSDRVFLFGWEQGAEMAYDVGLSHPDQFAGVLPMCGAPQFFAVRYWSNAQYLPFYVVEGDKHGACPKMHRFLFKDWIRNHYPSLYVEYKGRMSEWYDAEVPIVFEWMKNKKRAHPTKQLGRYHTGGGTGEEFKTSRTTDNRFYWLSFDGIHDRHVNDARSWSNLIPPATVQATIAIGNELVVKGGGEVKDKIWSQINVRTTGIRNLSIWLSPNMIDFTKPVLVRLNGQNLGLPRLIPPNVPLMLEEFYQTGDRQRLYWARIDLK